VRSRWYPFKAVCSAIVTSLEDDRACDDRACDDRACDDSMTGHVMIGHKDTGCFGMML